jgi:hypothetical protein
MSTLYWKVVITAVNSMGGLTTRTHDHLLYEEACALIGNFPETRRLISIRLTPSEQRL